MQYAREEVATKAIHLPETSLNDQTINLGSH